MKLCKTKINDCFYIENNTFSDSRGVFAEFFKQSDISFFMPKQSNFSFSYMGTFRGIHRTPYAKLVTCVKGSVYDICVDLRESSDTYGQYISKVLSGDQLNSLYIPPYCGHGFMALEDSIVIYHQGQEYDKELDQTFCFKSFDIKLPMDIKYISEKDSAICQKTNGDFRQR